MPHLLEQWLRDLGLSAPLVAWATHLYALLFFLLLAAGCLWIARRWLVPFLERSMRRSPAKWDDILVERGVLQRLAWLLPVPVLYFAADILFPAPMLLGEALRRLLLLAFVLCCLGVLNALLRAVNDIYTTLAIAKGKPIKGYLQAFSILAYVVAIIFVIAILTNKSPWGLLTLFGGLTAIILLVFKDTILGFIASIQLTAHDMVRVGDWIEMPKYQADGDVIDVTIHTVKVQNWDRTISTIPTYAMVAEGFTNWRGMQESGGRRIKRSLFLDMNSISFCTPEMLARFQQIELLKEYLAAKEAEIAADNAGRRVNPAHPVNGRRQTNIGVFRAYVNAYLRHHPQVHQEMTFLVRHLQPTPQGLPLEIYVFSRDQRWANYEAIQADIFDHLLAAVPHFNLRLFQYPSGHDLRGWQAGAPAPSSGNHL